MKKELLIVAGIQSNYRTLLKQAIYVGKNYNFKTRILDLNSLITGWKPYPNDWQGLGLASKVTKIETLKDLRRFVRKKSTTCKPVVLFLYPPHGNFRKAWKILQSRFPETGLITISPVPNASRQQIGSPSLTLKYKVRSLAQKIKSLAKPVPSFWIISGSECIPIFTSYFRSLKSTKLIYTHSLEYEFFNYSSDDSSTQGITSNDYLLVLDQGWFSKPKPDFLTDKEYPPAPRQKFSKEIRSVLHQISNTTGLEILVSCHPKASIEDTKEIYKGFRVVNQSSAELVRNCTVALANTSTSIGYAIMADKPLILFTSDELSRSIIHKAEVAISKELNIDFINISDVVNLNIDGLTKSVYRHRYEAYCKRYIRQEAAPCLPLWDSIYSNLSNLT